MKSTFAALLQQCGLSTAEAARYLGARENAVRSWSSGRRNAPPAMIDRLVDLDQRISLGVTRALSEFERLALPQTTVDLTTVATDAQARARQLPCVGAHREMIARVATALQRRGVRVHIVPIDEAPTLTPTPAGDRLDDLPQKLGLLLAQHARAGGTLPATFSFDAPNGAITVHVASDGTITPDTR